MTDLIESWSVGSLGEDLVRDCIFGQRVKYLVTVTNNKNFCMTNFSFMTLNFINKCQFFKIKAFNFKGNTLVRCILTRGDNSIKHFVKVISFMTINITNKCHFFNDYQSFQLQTQYTCGM